SAVYIGQLSLMLEGELDISAFRQAWQEAVNRHAVLRSTFAWENLPEPLQVVHRNVQPPLVEVDLRELCTTDQERAMEALIESDRGRGFELCRAPLIRLALIRLKEDLHQFIWTHHHLLLDGWSMSLLLTEVFRRYEAARRNRPAQLPSARPYRDYIAWLGRQ